MMTNKILNFSGYLSGLQGDLKIDEPMARHTSWRAGGKVRYFYSPSGQQDLIHCLQQLPANLPVYWVGLGSNLLVRDGGLAGLVINTRNGFNQIELMAPHQLYAESGASSACVARMARQHQLTGIEFLAGIPGTIGGALAMNAGAYTGQTWDCVARARLINRAGELLDLIPAQIDIDYRQVILPQDHWFISAIFDLHPAVHIDDHNQSKKLRDRRHATQPVQTANAGSVFKNPKSDYAARLLEAVGMKGERCGGAVVSNQHANFIINQNNASATDIEALIKLGQARVADTFGIMLETEVKIIGVSR